LSKLSQHFFFDVVRELSDSSGILNIVQFIIIQYNFCFIFAGSICLLNTIKNRDFNSAVRDSVPSFSVLISLPGCNSFCVTSKNLFFLLLLLLSLLMLKESISQSFRVFKWCFHISISCMVAIIHQSFIIWQSK
jgi:hypothetical protein